MIGLLLPSLAAIWLVIVAFASAIVIRKMSTLWRIPIAFFLFVFLLPLPLVDEIVGKKQFNSLCSEKAEIRMNKATAFGRTVYFERQPSVQLKGTWIPVTLRPMRFVDLISGEMVVSYDELVADGGWLARHISEGGVPLTFKGTCAPASRPYSIETFRALEMNYVEPPKKIK